MNLSILFYLFIVVICLSNSQTINNFHSLPSIYNNNTDGCEGKTSFSISHSGKIEYSDMVLSNNASDYFTNLGVLVFDQSDLTKQIFTVTYTIRDIGIYILQIRIYNISSGIDSTLNLGTVVCKKPVQRPLKIIYVSETSPRRFDSMNSTFIVQYNSTIGENSAIECTEYVNWVRKCTCYPIQKLETITNSLYCELTIGYSSSNIPPKLNITINIYPRNLNPIDGFNETFEINNPFPNVNTGLSYYNLIFPGIFTYKPTEDFIIQRDGLISSSAALVFTYTRGGLVIPGDNTNIYLVSKNDSNGVDIYFLNFNYNYNSQDSVVWNYADYFAFSTAFTMSLSQTNISIDQTITYSTQANIISPITVGSTEYIFVNGSISTLYVHGYNFSYNIYKENSINIPMSLNLDDVNQEYSFDFPISSYFKMENISLGFGLKTLSDSFSWKTLTLNSNSNDSDINIESIKFDTVSALGYLVTISVYSKRPLVHIYFGSEYLDQSNLIQNSENGKFYGKFQKYVKERNGELNIVCKDMSGYEKIYREGEPLNSNFDIVPKYPSIPSNLSFVGITDLTYFEFQPSALDFSNGPMNVTLYFNFSKSVPDMIPYIVFDNNEDIRYTGYYHPYLQLFRIEMIIDDWLINSNYYKIRDLNEYLVDDLDTDSISAFLNNKLGIYLANINIYGDNSPPMVAELYHFKNSTTLGWTMRIEQLLKGFKYGIVEIQSELDPLPIVVEITSKNRVSGDQFNGNYTFEIQPSLFSKPRIYKIYKITLYSNSLLHVPYNNINSVIGTEFESNLNTTFSGNLYVEFIRPTLVSMDIPTTVQVGGSNRTLEINFTTYDSTGLSSRHNPIIYLTSENGDIYSISSNVSSRNLTHANYYAKDQLPYGFGYRYIFVSVKGIMDLNHNIKSYTTSQLQSDGFPFSIQRQFDISLPVLERSSFITNRGGSLTLFGKSMGEQNSNLIVYINYQDGKGYQSIIPSFRSSSVIILNQVQKTTTKFITIQINVDQKLSNELNVYPISTNIVDPITTNTPSPSNTPTSTHPPTSICPGTPPCNDRGSCNVNLGCECKSPWYGPSCSSKIIPIQPLTPHEEPSTGTTLTDPRNSTITSIIKIVEIREIDSIENTIKRHSIKHWNWKDLSNSQGNPRYEYTSQVNETLTEVKVVVEFFNNQTEIPFGDKLITIHPSSIKYTISLTPYPFISKTNLLQVIMDATIKGDNQDSCSSSQFGSQNNTKENVQWIKMNIDDTSLYGRFIDIGIIDDRVTKISNKIIDDSDSQDSHQLRSIRVGITVPYFEESVYLDPDFSNLIDVNDQSVNLQCKSKKKLSSGAIAGIVVGCVVAVSITLATTKYILQRKKTRRENKKMSKKLESMNKSEKK